MRKLHRDVAREALMRAKPSVAAFGRAVGEIHARKVGQLGGFDRVKFFFYKKTAKMSANLSENPPPADSGNGAAAAPGNDEDGDPGAGECSNALRSGLPPSLANRSGPRVRGRGRGAASAAAAAENQLPQVAPPPPPRGRGRPRGQGNRGASVPGAPRHVPLYRSVNPAPVLPSSDEEVDLPNFLREDADAAFDADGAWTMSGPDGGRGGFVHGTYHQSSHHLLRDDPHLQSPSFFLGCFFDSFFWEKIVLETNRFMHQQGAADSLHTTVVEIKRWFGLLMIIASFQLPNLDFYWKTLNFSQLHFLHPCFRNVMSRERFSFLSQHIHLVNNLDDLGRDHPARDPLFKLRWVVDKFNKRCKKVWQLGVHVSPDEGLVPTYSPNPIESFCPKPGGSYGVLIRFTCCAEKWFCYHVFIEDKVSRTLSQKLDLMLEGVKPGQICYIDRFYTTFDTVTHLHSRGLGVVGTCMVNRFPPHPSSFKLPENHVRGDYVACEKGPVVALIWHDSDLVHCLCNVYGAERTDIARTVQDGSRRSVPGPMAFKMFGKHMQGGDRLDQMRTGHYGVSHHFRTSKWWLKAFLGIFDIALTNSWILFKETRLANATVVSHAEFWLEVAAGLVGGQTVRLVGTAVPHSLRSFAPTDGPDGTKRKRPCCVVCSQHGVKGRTVYGCVTCRVALHPECDKEWHHLAREEDMGDYVFDDWHHGEHA